MRGHEKRFDLVAVCVQSLAQLHHGDGARIERVAEETADVSAVDPVGDEIGRGPAHRRHCESVLEFPVVTLKSSGSAADVRAAAGLYAAARDERVRSADEYAEAVNSRSRLNGNPNPGISGPLARCPLRVETERRDAQFREGVVAGAGDPVHAVPDAFDQTASHRPRQIEVRYLGR